MNDALTRLVTANVAARGPEAALLHAYGAQTSALRILTLLPPHIAEESDAKMDALEVSIAAEDVAG